ncbi:MAG: LLM class flavin-dependent oxidoreductase [Candidatus Mycalebacterium zealandia]|nr:MAG: LLM class flavin-dependent oxidoreductase [Candidatus Mycalebacterium zealandia]
MPSTKTKFGITAPVPGTSVGGLVDFIVKCEKAGFDSLWIPDHVVFIADKETPEAWSVITAAAGATSKIQMGTIGDPHRLHPAIFAQRLATVSHIAGDRIFACLGYGEKMNTDPYGIEWDKPLGRLKESVEVMRKLWTGKRTNFKGKFFRLEKAKLTITPSGKNQKIPLYIAATGPKALKIAGKTGDGWVTNAMPSRVFSKKLKEVGGKSKNPDFEKCLFMFVSVAKNTDDTYATIEPVKHALVWPELLKDAGYNIKIADRYKGLSYTKVLPTDTAMIKKFREMGEKYYTREMLADFVIFGTPDEVAARIKEYEKAGVNHFIFRDFSPDRDYSLNTLSEMVSAK